MIPSFDRLRVSENLETGQYNLSITNVSRTDVGTYRCETKVQQHNVEHEIDAVLAEPPTNIRMEDETVPGKIFGNEFMSVTIRCSVDIGTPSTTSMKLSVDSKITVATNKSNLVSFSFNASRKDHMKIFKCVADNAFFTVEKKIQLFVFLSPVVSLTCIPTCEVDEGKNLTILCANETNTSPTELFWLVNGVIIPKENSSFLPFHNISRHNSGTYTCKVKNRVGIGTNSINVRIKYKPYVVEYTKTYLVEANSRKPTYLSFIIDSNTQLYVSWIKTLGGKLGYWNIFSENENLFNISSTIVTNSNEQYGVYIFRVRNSVGSIDLKVQLVGNIVRVSPDFVTCNVSTHVNLSCSITTGGSISFLQNSWVHLYNDNIIRKLEGIVLNTTSILTIYYCDYRDSGVYMCEWAIDNRIFSASTEIRVYSNPIYASQSHRQNGEILTLDVMFFSCPKPFEIVWFYNDRPIDNDSLIMNNLRITKVELNVYNKLVLTDGYIVSAFINNSQNASVDQYSTQVRNIFGNMDKSFSINTIDSKLSEKSYISNITLYWTTIAVDAPTQKSLYDVIFGTGVTIFLLLNTAVLVAVLRQRSLKDILHIKPKDRIQREQPSVDIIHLSNNPSYEEIASVSYQDVTWRNYAFETDSSEEEIFLQENEVNDNSSIEQEDYEQKETDKNKYEVPNEQTLSLPQNTYIEII